MLKVRGRVVLVLVSAVMLAGCAARHAPGLNDKFIRPAPKGAPPAPAPYDVGAPKDSLETAMGKIRELSARARPVPKQVSGMTIESFDKRLAAALLALSAMPGAETHRLVADEYARLGIFDAAFKHYRAAIAVYPSDGRAYDGLARLWRDAGFPALALGDAQRAVYFAPGLPAVRNTLGTILQALGADKDARRAYEFAVALDPSAAYALNNLGYLALMKRDTNGAVTYLQKAIAADPALTAARHNLALAYAASGRMELAGQALLEAGPVARADYNLGIINLALGRRAEAGAAFDSACRIDPGQREACKRANAVKSSTETGDGRRP